MKKIIIAFTLISITLISIALYSEYNKNKITPEEQLMMDLKNILQEAYGEEKS